MRKLLKKMNGDRKQFTARFERTGLKKRFKPILVDGKWQDYDATVLLTELKTDSGVPVADHLWINHTTRFNELMRKGLKGGDKIAFYARVKPYEKGYVNERECLDERTIDYTLRNPTKFRRIE